MTNQILFSEEMPGLTVERARRDGSFTMPQVHFHNTCEIYFLLEGERSYFIENRTYRVAPGGLAFVGRNRIHKTLAEREGCHERILLEIEPQLLRRSAGYFGSLPLQEFFLEDSGVLNLLPQESAFVRDLLLRMARELHARPIGCEECASLMLGELLLFIFRRAGAAPTASPVINSEKHRKVYEIASYISESYAEITTIDELSRRFFLSKYYLCHIFREVTGLTVSEYINDRRVMAAQKLLAETDGTVAEIAAAVGYDSVTYFDRVFSRSIGQSPMQYRKQHPGCPAG